MISIIIPTLNEATVLEKTLKALESLALSHEVIVSDGKSQDGTEKIARSRADTVVIYQGKKRQTIANARNLGAQKAKGQYLLFLDADVQIKDAQKTLLGLVEAMEGDDSLVAITVSLKVFPRDAWWQDPLFFGFMNTLHRVRNNVLHTGASPGEFQFIRRTAFENVRGYDERLVACEDMDLFKRLSKKGKTRFFAQYTAYHSGRRAHKVGYAKLTFFWAINAFWAWAFHRSYDAEWRPIR